MRRLMFAASLFAASYAVPASAGDQDFKLVNKTGYQIDEVYVSRSSARNWGRDVMGRRTLGHNRSVDITFTAPSNACRWDLKVKYEDGDTAQWNDLNLCRVNSVTLFWNRRDQTTRAVTD